MPTLAQLESQRNKAEAAKLAAEDRLATLDQQIDELKKKERTQRERTVGKLAVEAGLGEWSDEDLLMAFQCLAADPKPEASPSPIAAD